MFARLRVIVVLNHAQAGLNVEQALLHAAGFSLNLGIVYRLLLK